jgi:alanyl-tRNA synthetase
MTSNHDQGLGWQLPLQLPEGAAIDVSSFRITQVGADDDDGRDMAYRVVADHIRTLSFAIADGARPGNEGREYVLRRVLRRAVRYGREVLGGPEGFFASLVDSVVTAMGGFYPEIPARRDHIYEVLR